MAKTALVDGLVSDALVVLAAFENEAEDATATSAFGLLALVTGQDVEQGEGVAEGSVSTRVVVV